jgi:hypothetical protein
MSLFQQQERQKQNLAEIVMILSGNPIHVVKDYQIHEEETVQ